MPADICHYAACLRWCLRHYTAPPRRAGWSASDWLLMLISLFFFSLRHAISTAIRQPDWYAIALAGHWLFRHITLRHWVTHLRLIRHYARPPLRQRFSPPFHYAAFDFQRRQPDIFAFVFAGERHFLQASPRRFHFLRLLLITPDIDVFAILLIIFDIDYIIFFHWLNNIFAFFISLLLVVIFFADTLRRWCRHWFRYYAGWFFDAATASAIEPVFRQLKPPFSIFSLSAFSADYHWASRRRQYVWYAAIEGFHCWPLAFGFSLAGFRFRRCQLSLIADIYWHSFLLLLSLIAKFSTLRFDELAFITLLRRQSWLSTYCAVQRRFAFRRFRDDISLSLAFVSDWGLLLRFLSMPERFACFQLPFRLHFQLDFISLFSLSARFRRHCHRHAMPCHWCFISLFFSCRWYDAIY